MEIQQDRMWRFGRYWHICVYRRLFPPDSRVCFIMQAKSRVLRGPSRKVEWLLRVWPMGEMGVA